MRFHRTRPELKTFGRLFFATASLPFFGNAVTFGISALRLIGVGRLVPPATQDVRPKVLRSVRNGVAYLARHPELRMLAMGNGALQLHLQRRLLDFVLFARNRLHVSETGFGYLLASAAVGGLAAGYLVPKLKRDLRASSIYALGLAAQGLACLVFVSNAWVAGAVLALDSSPDTDAGQPAGRVSATTRVAGIGAASVGTLIGGVAGEVLGLTAPLLVAAIVSVLAVVAFVVVAQGREDQ